MEWFRLWHHMPNNAKWGKIARRTGLPRTTIVAVVVAIFDASSRSDERGSVTGVDLEEIAVALDIADAEVVAVLQALRDIGFVNAVDRILSWEEKQPKYDSSAGRTRNYRERKKGNGADPDPPGNGHVTSHNVTTCHGDTPESESESESDTEIDGWMDTRQGACATPFFKLGARKGIPPDLLQAVLDAKHGSETSALKALQRAHQADVKNPTGYLVATAEGRPFEPLTRKERKRRDDEAMLDRLADELREKGGADVIDLVAHRTA